MVKFEPVVGVTAAGDTVTQENIERIEVNGGLVGFSEKGCPIALIRPVSQAERAEMEAMALARWGEAVKINGPPAPPPEPDEPEDEGEDDE